MTAQRRRDHIDVRKVLSEFRESEESESNRKGKFRIDAKFDTALNEILKAPPEPRNKKKRRK